MTNSQALSITDRLDTKLATKLDTKQNQQQTAQSSLAIMQAGIDTALQKKQQAKINPSISDQSDSVQSKAIKSADMANNRALDASGISRVIEMAWEDRTPFSAIEHSYGLNEADVITLMRQQLKPSSFRLWRQRVTGRATKHQAKRTFMVGRAYCKTQYKPR
jgi:uncharacterized protein (TIGR03643 family)